MLTIQNDGQRIIATNYWGSTYEAAGYYYLSSNAGALRLLVPDNRRHEVADMKAATMTVLTVGPWPEKERAQALELLFDDESNTPFVLWFGTEQVDRLPAADDYGRVFPLTVWLQGDDPTDGPSCVATFQCGLRRGRIPNLKAWSTK